MTIAIFPGSFDPITNGHIDIVAKAADMFNQVYVVVMTNTHKNYLFNINERIKFAKSAIKNFHNVKVLKEPDKLTISVAKNLNAQVIIRGVRNNQDFLYEQQIAAINKKLAPNINTVLLFTEPNNSFIASSMIKEVARFGGNITQFLPIEVAKAMKSKIRQSDEK